MARRILKIDGTRFRDSSDREVTFRGINVAGDGKLPRNPDIPSHVREGFFDAAKFPTMTFQSTKITKAGDGMLKMTGNLTIKGVTKEVTFDVTGPTAPVSAMGSTRRGVSATGKINRQDFGVSKDPGMVGDDITIMLDLEMTPPAAPKP